MPHFKAKMHQIQFLLSVPFVRSSVCVLDGVWHILRKKMCEIHIVYNYAIVSRWTASGGDKGGRLQAVLINETVSFWISEKRFGIMLYSSVLYSINH